MACLALVFTVRATELAMREPPDMSCAHTWLKSRDTWKESVPIFLS